MNRLTTRTGGDRTAMGVSRAVVDTINDSPFMQTMGAKIMGEEQSSDIETMHPFGMTSVPMGKTTDEQAKAGMLKGAAEVLITGLMGNRSHPIASPPTDRRFRLNGLGAGETGFHDAYQQFLHMGKDAARLISPKRVSLEVSKEKPQATQSSGSDAKAPKRNNGADVGAERERMGGIVFNEDGSWTLEAKGPGKIKIGDVTWEFSSEGLKQTGGKHTHDGRNVGKDHKHGGVQVGAAQTGEPAA